MVRINRNPTTRELRQFAGIWFPAFTIVLGLIINGRLGAFAIAVAIWTFGAAVLGLGLAKPVLVKWLFVGLSYVTFPIGWIVSNIVLLVIFYLLLAPLGLLLRLTGHDLLRRTLDPSARTYWRPRPTDVPIARYFRQY